ncbi:MAG: hypothetical protein Q9214_002054 [Letrouitia sp. 1 TL-2023]
MDPVSITGLLASVETLAQGAFRIISLINTIRHGGKQRLRLLGELSSLWMVLKLLEGHFDEDEQELSEPWLRTIAVLNEENGTFDLMATVFNDLTDRLQPKTGHRKVLQTLRWPFEKPEVDGLLVRLERLKSNANTALNSTNAAVTREIQYDTRFIKASVANDEVQADHLLKQSRKGTGEWFLQRQEFREWMSREETMLWCPGILGAGKTFLASIMSEYLKKTRKDQNAAVLVLYCGYNEAKSQSIDNLIAALIKQNLQIHPTVSKNLKELYYNHSRTGVFPSLEGLIKVLREELSHFDSCFIIMDALDELLDEPKRRMLIESLAHGKVHLALTSRPLDSIRDLFVPVGNINCDGCEEEKIRFIYSCRQCGYELCNLCFEKDTKCPRESHYILKKFVTAEIEIKATETDVRNYVEWRIDDEPKLFDCVNKKRSLREQIAWTIVQQANGM